jgi:hypothetical protein
MVIWEELVAEGTRDLIHIVMDRRGAEMAGRGGRL